MQTLSKSGHVYLIKARGTSPTRYKIGMTQEGRMGKRFEELNGSQSAYPLEIVRVIDVEDRFTVEAELHRQFKGYRKHGEWFEFRNISEVERAMSQAENSRSVSGSIENWRIVSLIAGIIFLLLAWQSYQGDRARQQLPNQYIEQGD